MPDQSFFFRFRYSITLLLLAVAWILSFGYLLQGWSQTFVTPDAQSYIDAAENLYVYWRGHNYRPMLMAAINGIPFLVGFAPDAILPFAFWVNLVCWLASVWMLFATLKQFAKPNLAFVLTLLFVFCTGINAVVFELATEPIYLAMVLTGSYFLTRYQITGRFQFLAVAIAVFVLSMLIKPGSKLYAILLTAIFLKPIIFNYTSKYAWLIYGSYLLVLTQCLGMRYQFGNFTLSYIDAVTYYDYLGARAESLQQQKPFKEVWLERATYIYSKSCPAQKQIAMQDFTRQLTSNTGHLLAAYGTNLIENATTGSVQIQLMQNAQQSNYFNVFKSLVYSISELQNIIGSLLGILLSGWAILRFRKQQQLFALIGAFVLYTIFLSGISCSEGDRFNMVTFPLTLILFANILTDKKKELSA